MVIPGSEAEVLGKEAGTWDLAVTGSDLLGDLD